MVIVSEIPASALAVYAHPDDPEVACGGTLARWARAGCRIHLVVANRGEKGSNDPAADGDALAAARAEEVARAADVLGVATVEHLGYPDGELDDGPALRRRLVEIIRRERPEALVAPDPTAVFFGDSYINHRDHRQLGWAVLDSIVPAASALYEVGTGDAHQVRLLLLSGTLEPSAWVDIADVLDVKVKAVSCHETRVPDDPALVTALLEARAQEEGARCGLALAEGFRRLSFG